MTYLLLNRREKMECTKHLNKKGDKEGRHTHTPAKNKHTSHPSISPPHTSRHVSAQICEHPVTLISNPSPVSQSTNNPFSFNRILNVFLQAVLSVKFLHLKKLPVFTHLFPPKKFVKYLRFPSKVLPQLPGFSHKAFFNHFADDHSYPSSKNMEWHQLNSKSYRCTDSYVKHILRVEIKEGIRIQSNDTPLYKCQVCKPSLCHLSSF